MRPTTGTISLESPRAAEWLKTYGSLTVPLLSPAPVSALGPDGEPRLFYRVDVGALSPSQQACAARHIADRFGLSIEEVVACMRSPEHGIPLLADDVTVTFDARMVI